MPKLPRISGKECVAALTRMGFVLVRQRGSHLVLRRGSDGCVVPNHKEIRTGSLSGILKQANVSVEELIENL
jgi:predicted RNA binding protein YcfA (HicA-like mRNA interferase family)